ncbi:MAG: hypothetical protein IJI05_06305 [Erysipelotrichaceae bacterium]|nr:hypothetical protein [Erysipelotrichaceae bacterium]
MLTDTQKKQILEGALAGLSDEQKSAIRSGAIDLAMASDEVQGKMSDAAQSVKQLAQLKAQLDTYNQFYIGLVSYTSGVSSAASGAYNLASGAGDLKSGAGTLSDGAYSMYEGTLELKNSLPSLIDGIIKLRNGSGELADGITRFDEEAIEKLTETLENDLDGLTDRLHALKEAAEEFTYSDVRSNNMKFIYKTDEIHAD